MYLGIDLGTSAVKTVLVDDTQRVIATRSRSLDTFSPGYRKARRSCTSAVGSS